MAFRWPKHRFNLPSKKPSPFTPLVWFLSDACSYTHHQMLSLSNKSPMNTSFVRQACESVSCSPVRVSPVFRLPTPQSPYTIFWTYCWSICSCLVFSCKLVWTNPAIPPGPAALRSGCDIVVFGPLHSLIPHWESGLLWFWISVSLFSK